MPNAIPTQAELAEMMRLKRKLLRQRNLALSVEERIAKFWRLQESSFELLRSDPKSYARFIQRNLKKRAIALPPDVEIPEKKRQEEVRESGEMLHEEILQLLRRHQVEFVVIGALAVNAHGHIRATEDADIVFRRTPENEKALLAALQELNACWVMTDKAEPGGVRLVPVTESYIAHMKMMLLITDAGLLDLFDHIPGFPDEPVDSLFADCELRNGVRYVSLHWLKKMKQTSGRPMDLIDLERLEGTP